jgi:hypothetical protein
MIKAPGAAGALGHNRLRLAMRAIALSLGSAQKADDPLPKKKRLSFVLNASPDESFPDLNTGIHEC